MIARRMVVIGLLLAAAAGTVLAAGRPEPYGRAVIEYITRTDPYRNWQMWPGKEKLYEGQHPHGAYLTTYVNPKAAEALRRKSGKLPDGAMIVKENYTEEKELAAITVMYRYEGYNPDGGDYFWLKYAPDGTILKAGSVTGCIGCHRSVVGNDWLFTGPIE